jgi:DNA-binding Xre family transcriptional regulator
MTLPSTFCEPQYLQGFTNCERYNAAVSAKDAVLEKLRRARIGPTVLAAAIGVTKQQASMMLQGKRGIPTWHLDRIADLLATSVPDLFVIPRADLAHKKILKPVTFSVPVDGVSSEPARTKVIRDALPEEPIDVQAAPVRPPIKIAVELQNQAAELRARADALTVLASELTRGAVRSVSPRAHRQSERDSPVTGLRKRTDGRRRGHR